MTDAVDTLATDYQELRLRTFPTWAHMIGDYGYVDRFEEVGREAEDRQIAEAREFAARAEAIPDGGLSADDRISREMVAWDATARAASRRVSTGSSVTRLCSSGRSSQATPIPTRCSNISR